MAIAIKITLIVPSEDETARWGFAGTTLLQKSRVGKNIGSSFISISLTFGFGVESGRLSAKDFLNFFWRICRGSLVEAVRPRLRDCGWKAW
jgi:hypothetical protein